MRWPRRPTRLPDDARAALELEPGERVLAVARARDGAWAVATDRALLGGGWRVEWSAATHAQWLDEESTLAVTALEPSGETVLRSLVLDEPGLLPETVHERVMATILVSRHLRVDGRRGVRVVARRQPASDEVVWQLVADSGIDPDDPEVAARVAALLAELTVELGLD